MATLTTNAYYGQMGNTPIWTNWINSSTSSATSTTTTIWTAWNTVGTGQLQGTMMQPPPTQQDQEDHNRRIREAADRTRAAAERAQGLLEAHLTPAQRKTLKDKGWFIVQGGRSKRKYAIHTNGIAGNIYPLDKHIAVERLCCHAEYGHALPNPDHWLSQKLWIESCEDEFLRLANRSGVAGLEFREAA